MTTELWALAALMLGAAIVKVTWCVWRAGYERGYDDGRDDGWRSAKGGR